MIYAYIDLDRPPMISDVTALVEQSDVPEHARIEIQRPNFWTFRLLAFWETETVSAEVIAEERAA